MTPAVLAQLFAQESDEAAIILLTITHADLDDPIRACSNSLAVVSRGITFPSYPFRLTLPNSGDDATPRATIEIDNVDQSIVNAIRTAQGDPPKVHCEIVWSSDFDVVEYDAFTLDLLNADADYLVVSGELGLPDPKRRPYPAGMFTPAQWPGVF